MEGGGSEQRRAHAVEMLTPVFFFFFLTPLCSRGLWGAARVDLTTYGMAGSMNDHMTAL